MEKNNYYFYKLIIAVASYFAFMQCTPTNEEVSSIGKYEVCIQDISSNDIRVMKYLHLSTANVEQIRSNQIDQELSDRIVQGISYFYDCEEGGKVRIPTIQDTRIIIPYLTRPETYHVNVSPYPGSTSSTSVTITIVAPEYKNQISVNMIYPGQERWSGYFNTIEEFKDQLPELGADRFFTALVRLKKSNPMQTFIEEVDFEPTSLRLPIDMRMRWLNLKETDFLPTELPILIYKYQDIEHLFKTITIVKTLAEQRGQTLDEICVFINDLYKMHNPNLAGETGPTLHDICVSLESCG